MLGSGLIAESMLREWLRLVRMEGSSVNSISRFAVRSQLQASDQRRECLLPGRRLFH